jgi:hypothetical protein
VTECEPIESEDVVKLAMPELLMAPIPRTAAPSMKVMEPVALVFTTAVKVTDWLTVVGLMEEVSVTAPAAFATVIVVVGDVAVVVVGPAGTTVVIGAVPVGKVEVVRTAVPPTIGAVPIGVPPS